ncbi:uncharacterized protein LOC6602914 [Drosophila persimilis]|uniref:uncharacterized protein LOC6602914 n=1 Tax=Drosophila persimilis TaxID=7234 RepID=UPI000F0811C7|nr:uncharacterized protein LOC6602914 [Drosophila persimilis]
MYRDRDHQLTESCPESEYSRPGGFAGNVDADGPASTESTEVPVELGSEFAMPVKHVDVRSAHSLGHPSPGACQEVYPTIDQRMDEIKSNIWSGTPSYSAPCSYQKPSYTVFRLQLRSPQCQDPEKINAGNDALQTARSRSTMCQAVAIPRRAEAPRAVTEPRRSTRFSDDWSLEFESSTSINHHADQSGLSRTDAGADDEPSSPADEQDMSLGSGIEASSSSFWDEHETHGYRSHNRNTARASRMASYGRTRDKGARSYEEWLTLKKKEAFQQQRQERREAHRLTVAERIRKQMSDKSYSSWLASKQQRHLGARLPVRFAVGSDGAGAADAFTHMKSAHLPFVQVKSAPRVSTLVGGNGRKPARSPEEVQRRVEQWELNKMREQERQRSARQREKAQLQAMAEERGRQSKLAWERWMARLAIKPRPVPLNRRPESLTRSTASIYVNQKMWHHGGLGAVPKSPDTRFQGRPPVALMSSAQRALRQRLDEIDGVRMHPPVTESFQKAQMQ